MSTKFKIAVFALLLTSIFTSLESKAQIHKIQATFVVNFFRYIQWSEFNGDKFVVGVWGSDHEMYGELKDAINGQKYRNTVVEVKEITSLDDISKCQILYFPSGNSSLSKKMTDAIQQNSILVITEEQNFMPSYAVINFKVVNDRLTFSINQKNAQDRQLAINSKLIAMSK